MFILSPSFLLKLGFSLPQGQCLPIMGTLRGSVRSWTHSFAEKANARDGKWEVDAWREAKPALTPKIDSGKAARRKS